MRIAIGSDHAGFELKETLKAFLARQRAAQTQRLLWASTGTNNPRYRDVRYVAKLIGPDTVTTMTPSTLAAFRDHGRPRASLVEDRDHASETVRRLAKAGISLTATADTLLAEDVRLFADAYRLLLEAVEEHRGRHAGAAR